ncbi:RHS repeat-associated core domain-containing protein [Lentisphaerota bacterium WC36G]|nr:hypothetical protein LJT99_02240 [Lentisphaerae bacterium WC36]
MNNGSISDRFVWLGDNLLALEKDGVAFNYIADGNKNITQLINLTTGEIANKYDYSPFGQLAKTDENVENVFKFSSEYAEKETGLIYYNYRYYNPTTGKWLSRDPIGERGGMNVYGFVNNNVINYSDSYGLKKEYCCKEKDINKIAAQKSLQAFNEAKKKMHRAKQHREKEKQQNGHPKKIYIITQYPEKCGQICCSKKGNVSATGPKSTHKQINIKYLGTDKKTKSKIYLVEVKPMCKTTHHKLKCPKGTKTVADYHSHSASPNFSRDDLAIANRLGRPIYLGYDGTVKKGTPKGNKEYELNDGSGTAKGPVFDEHEIDPKTGEQSLIREDVGLANL